MLASRRLWIAAEDRRDTKHTGTDAIIRVILSCLRAATQGRSAQSCWSQGLSLYSLARVELVSMYL